MTETPRREATSHARTPAPQGGRARTGLAALMAITMLALATFVTASAQGGSGGVGSGGGGDDAGSRGGDRYTQKWNGLSEKDKRWAHRVSQCEAGGDPNIHGGGGTYHGAFQFVKSTWRTSPKSPGGDPHKYTWKTQAVVAVALKHRDGKGHWPVCG